MSRVMMPAAILLAGVTGSGMRNTNAMPDTVRFLKVGGSFEPLCLTKH
jgi:hypothetical protein